MDYKSNVNYTKSFVNNNTKEVTHVMLTSCAIKNIQREYDNTLDNIVHMLNAILELGLVEWVINSMKIDYNTCKYYLAIKNHRYVRPWNNYPGGVEEAKFNDAVLKNFQEARKSLKGLNWNYKNENNEY
jgi:hypothetical protein